MATRKKKNNIGAFGHPIYGKGFAKYGEMQPNGSSEIQKDLEEAAEKFVGYDMDCDELRDYEIGIAAFIAGYNLCKEQMMKEAVEGLICATITGANAISFLSPLPKELTVGDKVRVIIVKED